MGRSIPLIAVIVVSSGPFIAACTAPDGGATLTLQICPEAPLEDTDDTPRCENVANGDGYLTVRVGTGAVADRVAPDLKATLRASDGRFDFAASESVRVKTVPLGRAGVAEVDLITGNRVGPICIEAEMLGELLTACKELRAAPVEGPIVEAVPAYLAANQINTIELRVTVPGTGNGTPSARTRVKFALEGSPTVSPGAVSFNPSAAYVDADFQAVTKVVVDANISAVAVRVTAVPPDDDTGADPPEEKSTTIALSAQSTTGGGGSP